jgi:hypothetical protein
MSRYLLPLSACLMLSMAACATTDETASAESATPEASASASTTDSTGTSSTSTTSSTSAPTPTSTTTTTSTTTNSATACNADAARSIVGKSASSDVVEQARPAAGADTARTLKPGETTTMEFNGNRLNIDVDANNMVTNVRCG